MKAQHKSSSTKFPTRQIAAIWKGTVEYTIFVEFDEQLMERGKLLGPKP